MNGIVNIGSGFDLDRLQTYKNLAYFLYSSDAVGITIGARDTLSTPLIEGTMFADPTIENGAGSGTELDPYSIEDAFNALPTLATSPVVLFLRGGTYDVSPPDMSGVDTTRGGIRVTNKYGTALNPITIESYPDEVAIIDGGFSTPAEVNIFPAGTDFGFYLNDVEYVNVRKIEVTRMSRQGIYLKGIRSKVQGCHTHHNFLTGIDQTTKYIGSTPLTDSSCIIEDNISHHNSDSLCISISHDDGDNGDGLSFNDGVGNIARYNTLYANSDEGIDMWRSNDTIAEYNLVHSNPTTNKGSGSGIKMGGNTDEFANQGHGNIARHNVIYGMSGSGILENASWDIVINNNTLWDIGNYLIIANGDRSSVYDNIGKEYALLGFGVTGINATNNSWQIGDNPQFISEVSTELGFLVPAEGIYDAIGAYV